MKEEMPNTGPAITEEVSDSKKRRITLEIGDSGVNMDLSHEFAVYEVYGLLLMSILDIYTKHSLGPMLAQMASIGMEKMKPEMSEGISDIEQRVKDKDIEGSVNLDSLIEQIKSLAEKK